MSAPNDPSGPRRPYDWTDAGEVQRRRARRVRARRDVLRRRRRAFVALVAAVAIAVSAAALSAGGPAVHRSRTARSPAQGYRPAPSPGSLPQTHAFPSATSRQFKALMGSLWTGIEEGSVTPALAAFFPRAAYLQVKEIPAAGADWRHRLVHGYALDIGAAHALLGSHAAFARLVAVNVPSGYGHWVEPGTCYNRIGYYEVPNARVVYREMGRLWSFGIASMISWRGVWYVVHLGAVLRSGNYGVVDEPTAGPGRSADSAGTC